MGSRPAGELVKAIEEDKFTKSGGVSAREKAELLGEVKNLFARYSDQEVTSTKLNKK